MMTLLWLGELLQLLLGELLLLWLCELVLMDAGNKLQQLLLLLLNCTQPLGVERH